jgi:hypothetical protein
MFESRLGCSTISFRHLTLHRDVADAVSKSGPDCIEAPGNINLSVGLGDVTDEHRPSATSAAGHVITTLLNRSTTEKMETS